MQHVAPVEAQEKKGVVSTDWMDFQGSICQHALISSLRERLSDLAAGHKGEG